MMKKIDLGFDRKKGFGYIKESEVTGECEACGGRLREGEPRVEARTKGGKLKAIYHPEHAPQP